MNSRRPELVGISALVLANLAVLLLSVVQYLETGLPIMTFDWGLLPERLTDALLNGGLLDVGYNLLTFVTSTFLHGGFDHFFNNMVLLVILGILVEREFGTGRFLAIYMVSGLAGSLGHYLMHVFSPYPMIGASGAVSGIMAAYLIAVFARGKRISMLRMVGSVFVIQWFVGQVSSMYLDMSARSGIAHGAHVFGFIGGLFISFLIARKMTIRERELAQQTPTDNGTSTFQWPKDEPMDNGTPTAEPTTKDGTPQAEPATEDEQGSFENEPVVRPEDTQDRPDKRPD